MSQAAYRVVPALALARRVVDAEIVPIQLVPHRLSPTVQKLAGHCHLSVTQRNAHTTEALMREAVQVFGKRTG